MISLEPLKLLRLRSALALSFSSVLRRALCVRDDNKFGLADFKKGSQGGGHTCLYKLNLSRRVPPAVPHSFFPPPQRNSFSTLWPRLIMWRTNVCGACFHLIMLVLSFITTAFLRGPDLRATISSSSQILSDPAFFTAMAIVHIVLTNILSTTILTACCAQHTTTVQTSASAGQHDMVLCDHTLAFTSSDFTAQCASLGEWRSDIKIKGQ